MKKIKAYGIDYKLPTAHLVHMTPLFVSEFAARTCYNSFDKSENDSIKIINDVLNSSSNIEDKLQDSINLAVNELNSNGSELLHQLSHVYFHESTLEHIQCNFFIKNTSRGVLQELARHRIANFSVQSTRYTLSDLINIFVAILLFGIRGSEDKGEFIRRIMELDMFVTTSKEFNALEIGGIYDKLLHQSVVLGMDKFLELTVAKSILNDVKASGNINDALTILNSKAKKNVGDVIKHIITDNVSVDLAFSINLRSLKNFLDLRLSSSAYWQIQLLAHAIYKEIPNKYLDLVVKDSKVSVFDRIDNQIKTGEWE